MNQLEQDTPHFFTIIIAIRLLAVSRSVSCAPDFILGATANNISSQPSTMRSLKNLPRELRQQILGLVFEAAITADVKFNRNLEKYIRSYDGCSYGRLELLHCKLPKYLSDALGPPVKLYTDPRPTEFAPDISRTATSLHVTFPDLPADINFVLSKSLSYFEKDMSEAYDRFVDGEMERSVWDDYVSNATGTWAYEAKIADGLADFGGNGTAIKVDNLTGEQVQKFGIVAVLRLSLVVGESYRRRRSWEISSRPY